MLFNSYIFILFFLPVCLLGYYLLNKTGKYQISNLFLIGMSLWFYGYYNVMYLPVITTSIVVNYALSQVIIRSEKERLQKAVLAIGIIANAASIFYFKYYDFFIGNINAIFKQSFELKHILLPLGISFFTFQQMSYLVDSYRGQTKDYGFIEYALFVVYFPQLIAGPIVLHKETIPQFRDETKRHFSFDNAAHGLYIFAIGLFKKVLIADTFSSVVTWSFSSVEQLTTIDAIVMTICYTLQLYFDFSGYCDMAIGIGNMFNIDLPQNFNSPYKARSIVDFWSRWHMSLTRFLREYVYFPLGGSKKGKARTYLNIMIVFLVSGLWHGANWTFVAWGALHGLFNCLTRMGQKLWDKVNVVIQWLLTFSLVNALWVLFRAENFSQAIAIYKKMLPGSDWTLSADIFHKFQLPEFAFLQNYIPPFKNIGDFAWYLWFILFFGGAFVIVLLGKNMQETKPRFTVGRSILTCICLVWSIMSLSGVSEFLYWGF